MFIELGFSSVILDYNKYGAVLINQILKLIFRWHRLSLSVKGDSVTLLTDCKTVQTMQLPRPSPSHISQAGIGLLGQQLLEDDFFAVCAVTHIN